MTFQSTDDTAPATDLPPETVDAFDGDTLAARTLLEKYCIGNETTPEEVWTRVAREISSVEAKDVREDVREEFEWLLSDWRFVPGGRILAGAGNPKSATLTNCYFTSIEEDSIEAIFDWCKSAARTYSMGGGNGVDLAPLRPRGSPVNNLAETSTGAASFMELFSTTTGTIGQQGRRGALMITCPVWHPDIEEFVDAKAGDTDSVRYANISVRLTDDFMNAVDNAESYTLRWTDEQKGIDIKKVIDARTLWDNIVENAHKSAEPGLIFWDNAVRGSPSEYSESLKIRGCNPCSEQMLASNDACTLGHINLSRLVHNPFEQGAAVQWDELARVAQTGTRFLDDVVEYNLPLHAHDEQAEKARLGRRIGLGVTGLADMLAKLGVEYDSEEAVEVVDRVMKFIKDQVYLESIKLAKEKEPFPLFDANEHLERPFIQELDKGIRDDIQEYGLRNVCLLTVAPVGSGSVIAQTSSGVEPIYELNYKRRSESLSEEFHEVNHHLVREWAQAKKNQYTEGEVPDDLPDYFVTAHDIDPFFRVRLQATMQDHVDSAISSTINLPRDIDVDTVKDIYMDAWKQGCKGITVYREGAREGILLTDDEEDGEDVQVDAGTNGHKTLEPEERPDELNGTTYKVPTARGNAYITVTNKNGVPFECFVNISRSGAYTQAFAEGIARLISLHLRSGGDVEDIIDQLVGIRGPDVVFNEGEKVFSVPDAIGKALDNHVEGAVAVADRKRGEAPECPECGQPMVFEEGCMKCTACGNSKC